MLHGCSKHLLRKSSASKNAFSFLTRTSSHRYAYDRETPSPHLVGGYRMAELRRAHMSYLKKNWESYSGNSAAEFRHIPQSLGGAAVSSPSVTIQKFNGYFTRSSNGLNFGWQSEPFRTYGSVTGDAGGEKASSATTGDAGGEKASSPDSYPRSIDDFQHEEIVGPTVERDLSALANEFRETIVELRTSIRNLTAVLVVTGLVQLIWSFVMYFSMELPFSGAVLWQVLISVILPFGLAYHFWKSLKPVAFFTRLEERSRLRILTLSLQITKALVGAYQRGYGIAFIMCLALSSHLLSCIWNFLL